MTSHPNRGWRGRWIVEGSEARHGPSGLVVRLHRALDAAAWDGAALNGQEVGAALIERHGQQSAARMLARLMREAGDIFAEKTHSEYEA
jgi:hypothetical protein